LHRLLLRYPTYREKAHITHHYEGLFREFASTDPMVSTHLPIVCPD
jgi:hypothetical protein